MIIRRLQRTVDIEIDGNGCKTVGFCLGHWAKGAEMDYGGIGGYKCRQMKREVYTDGETR